MNAKLAVTVIGCACALAVRADNHNMTKNDDSPTSSFNTGVNWDDKAAPCPGHDYFTAGYSMRTPDAGDVADEHVFKGDSLAVNGGALAFKSKGSVTVDNLIMMSGNFAHWQGGLPQDARLFGNIEIPAGFYGKFQCTESENDTRIFRVHASITGSGTLEMEMGNSNFTANVKGVDLLGDNTGFFGRTLLRGFGRVTIPNEEALGVPPVSFVADQLMFQGSALRATNSLALDDPTRGIYLDNTVSPGGQRYPWGAFEVVGVNTMTVACVISGPGALIKRGTGMLLLAANNTYTGTTRVEAGTLRVAPGFSAVSGTMVVTGATAAVTGYGTLGAVTLDAGGTLMAEGSGWDVTSLDVLNGGLGIDLASADPDVAMIRVSGALTKPAFGALSVNVNTNDALQETVYKVLTASNLPALKDVDFCVNPPWLGTLSRSEDGTTLLFTPTFPEDIAFKTVSGDTMNDTGFTNSNWTTGLPPEAGKTYVSQTYELRLPPSGNPTFAGDRLIMDGRNISLKNSTGTATITDLTVMNEAGMSMTEDGNSRLAGNIMLHPALASGKSFALQINGWSNRRSLHLYAALAGYGRLELRGVGVPEAGNSIYNLLGDNTNFYGIIRMNGNSNFWLRVNSETNVGGALPEFRADALIFNGGGLGVTNDVTLTAGSGRGITLQAVGGTADMTTDTGSYQPGTPAEDRYYPGGATFRAESADVTLTVNLPVTGAGSLSTAGAGTVVLGGDNSHTGLTSVVAGALRVTSPTAFGTSPVIVRAGAALQVPYPALPAMPNGVELGAVPVFEEGARIEVALASEYEIRGSFTVPLFLLPAGADMDASAVPVVSMVEGYSVTALTETVGNGATERVRVSARFWFNGGTMLLLQ